MSTVVYKNVNLDISQQQLVDVFSYIGPCKAVQKISDIERSFNMWFINFKNPKDADKAMKDPKLRQILPKLSPYATIEPFISSHSMMFEFCKLSSQFFTSKNGISFLQELAGSMNVKLSSVDKCKFTIQGPKRNCSNFETKFETERKSMRRMFTTTGLFEQEIKVFCKLQGIALQCEKIRKETILVNVFGPTRKVSKVEQQFTVIGDEEIEENGEYDNEEEEDSQETDDNKEEGEEEEYHGNKEGAIHETDDNDQTFGHSDNSSLEQIGSQSNSGELCKARRRLKFMAHQKVSINSKAQEIERKCKNCELSVVVNDKDLWVYFTAPDKDSLKECMDTFFAKDDEKKIQQESIIKHQPIVQHQRQKITPSMILESLPNSFIQPSFNQKSVIAPQKPPINVYLQQQPNRASSTAPRPMPHHFEPIAAPTKPTSPSKNKSTSRRT